jgi:hypothetical protein
MTKHRPDVKDLTPIETQHITAECRENRTFYGAWEQAVHLLVHVYEAQTGRRPGATISIALYVTDPEE